MNKLLNKLFKKFNILIIRYKDRNQYDVVGFLYELIDEENSKENDMEIDGAFTSSLNMAIEKYSEKYNN